MRSVISFLTARNVSAADIDPQISVLYGPSAIAMSDSKFCKWVRAFKDGLKKVHDEPKLGSVITQDLVKDIEK